MWDTQWSCANRLASRSLLREFCLRMWINLPVALITPLFSFSLSYLSLPLCSLRLPLHFRSIHPFSIFPSTTSLLRRSLPYIPCAINTTPVSTMTHYTFHPSSSSPSSSSSSMSLPPPLLPHPFSRSFACTTLYPSRWHSSSTPPPLLFPSVSSRHHVHPSLPFPLTLPVDIGLPDIGSLPRCLPSTLAPCPSTQGSRLPEERRAQTQEDRWGERPSVHSPLLQAAHLLQPLHRLHLVTHKHMCNTHTHTHTQLHILTDTNLAVHKPPPQASHYSIWFWLPLHFFRLPPDPAAWSWRNSLHCAATTLTFSDHITSPPQCSPHDVALTLGTPHT